MNPCEPKLNPFFPKYVKTRRQYHGKNLEIRFFYTPNETRILFQKGSSKDVRNLPEKFRGDRSSNEQL